MDVSGMSVDQIDGKVRAGHSGGGQGSVGRSSSRDGEMGGRMDGRTGWVCLDAG
jgi:hypothetical protein